MLSRSTLRPLALALGALVLSCQKTPPNTPQDSAALVACVLPAYVSGKSVEQIVLDCGPVAVEVVKDIIATFESAKTAALAGEKKGDPKLTGYHCPPSSSAAPAGSAK